MAKMQEKTFLRRTARPVHKGPPVHSPGEEAQIFYLVMNQCQNALAVCTESIICRVLAVQSSFKSRDPVKLKHWVYEFICCDNLVLRSSIHVGQRLPGGMELFKPQFSCSVMTESIIQSEI